MPPRGGGLVIPLGKVDEVEQQLRAKGYEPSIIPISNKCVLISWLRSLDDRVNYTNVNFGNDLLMKEINVGIENALNVGFSYFNDINKLTDTEKNLVASVCDSDSKKLGWFSYVKRSIN